MEKRELGIEKMVGNGEGGIWNREDGWEWIRYSRVENREDVWEWRGRLGREKLVGNGERGIGNREVGWEWKIGN